MSHIEIYYATGDPISEKDTEAYGKVIEQAFAVHQDRERVRRGLWKKYPAEDQLKQVKIKLERVLHQLEEGIVDVDNVREELVDIINYSVFAYRIVDGEFS